VYFLTRKAIINNTFSANLAHIDFEHQIRPVPQVRPGKLKHLHVLPNFLFKFQDHFQSFNFQAAAQQDFKYCFNFQVL
jgi:hypothetical protein